MYIYISYSGDILRTPFSKAGKDNGKAVRVVRDGSW